MLPVRELMKNLAVLAPTHLLETISNYAVLRTGTTSLLPPETMSGVLKSLYFEAVAKRIGTDTPILFLEFGVWEGYSLGEWTRLNTHPESLFVGFDSFVGLPDRWRGRPAGYFSTEGAIPEIDDPRVSFEKGWFHDTLPAWLDNIAAHTDRTPVVHIDCDLHASALYVLAQLDAVLRGYHVLFDDYSAGEARALRDYMAAFGATFTPELGRKRTSYARVPGQVYGSLVTGVGAERPEARQQTVASAACS